MELIDWLDYAVHHIRLPGEMFYNAEGPTGKEIRLITAIEKLKMEVTELKIYELKALRQRDGKCERCGQREPYRDRVCVRCANE